MISTLERVAVALPLVLGAVATFGVCRRRIVFALGRRGRLLAPVFCLVLWLLGLTLAQAGGSLLLMSIGGAVPLLLLLLFALRTRPVRLRRRIDPAIVLALAAVGLYLYVATGFDSVCHLAVVGNYLRGNIPPTALNDPTGPLVYHPLFDAAAAVFTRAFGADLELGLDLVSMLSVAACASAAAALSRRLFPATPIAARLSVLCLLFGFGPTPLRLLWQPGAPSTELLRGQTNQSFLDQMLRRPYPLGLAVVCLLLAQLLDLGRRPILVRALLLAPPFFLIPQVAEEQLLVLGALVTVLLLLRRLPLIAAACAGAGALAGGLYSGVLRALVQPASMATPKVALAWPAVPTWAQPQSGWPIFSWGTLEVALLELGPIFFLTLLVLWKRGAHSGRTFAAVVVGNLVAACFLTLRGWPRADLDRFIFCASNLALIATPALLQLPLFRGRRHGPVIAVTLLALLLAGGSVPVAARRLASEKPLFRTILAERPYAQLRRELGKVVAPRDLIATDAGSAQLLIAAGFLVVAPLDSHMVGIVNPRRYQAYVAEHACRARWSWVPESDPRARATIPQVSLGAYALVPNTARCEPPLEGLLRRPAL
jgi:hypothetical protein